VTELNPTLTLSAAHYADWLMPHCRYLSKMKPLAHFIRQADPAFSCRVYLQLLKRMIESDDPTRFVHEPPALVLAALVGVEAEAAMLGDVATFRDKKTTAAALADHRASRAMLEHHEIVFFYPLSQLLPTVEEMEARLRKAEEQSVVEVPAIFDELGELANELFEHGPRYVHPDDQSSAPGYEDGRPRWERPAYVPGHWHIQRHAGLIKSRWEAHERALPGAKTGRHIKDAEAYTRHAFSMHRKNMKCGGLRVVDPEGNIVEEVWLELNPRYKDRNAKPLYGPSVQSPPDRLAAD
jgi:hypothetical protein